MRRVAGSLKRSLSSQQAAGIAKMQAKPDMAKRLEGILCSFAEICRFGKTLPAINS